MKVEAAYQACERITREQARNFAWGIRLLPGVKRRALSAVYAMARRIDDIGDGTLPEADKQGLDETRAIALMVRQPSMIKRPVLETGKGLLVGFKPERYADVFA